MDWLLFYQSGAVLTCAIALWTLHIMEGMTERERLELGVIFLFGLLVWPAMLYGLVGLNIQAWENREP